MFVNIVVLRLRSMDWKSSFSVWLYSCAYSDLCYIVSEHQAYRRLSECKETVNYTLPLRSSSSWRFFWADYEPAVFVLSTYTQLPCQEEQEHSHAEDGTLKSVDAVKILTTNMNADEG